MFGTKNLPIPYHFKGRVRIASVNINWNDKYINIEYKLEIKYHLLFFLFLYFFRGGGFPLHTRAKKWEKINLCHMASPHPQPETLGSPIARFLWRSCEGRLG